MLHNVLNVDITVVGAGPGAGPHVKVFDSNTRELKFSFSPYQGRFRGGVHVATGDVNGDGIPDIITAPGAGDAGAGPHVKVFDGATGLPLPTHRETYGFERTFLGGVYVAAGDVNGDGFAEIIASRASGKPEVRVFDGVSGNLLSSFFAYAPSFAGGVRVAAGDVNGDGFSEIITSPGAGRSGGHVKVFDGTSNTLLSSFLAYPGLPRRRFRCVRRCQWRRPRRHHHRRRPRRPAPRQGVQRRHEPAPRQLLRLRPDFGGGVRVAAGDVNGDGRDDIITGSRHGDPTHVEPSMAPACRPSMPFCHARPARRNQRQPLPSGLFVAASR